MKDEKKIDSSKELHKLADEIERISRRGELKAGLSHLVEVTNDDGTKVLRIRRPRPFH